jgi:hypothetical protein
MLYEITNEQHISVADLAQRDWRLTFRRWLDESAQNHLRQLRDIMMSCALGQQKDKPIWVWGKLKKDKPIWVWGKLKKFSVKSMYAHLCGGSPERITKESGKPNPSKDQSIYVALKQKCNSYKRQYDKKELAG